MNNLQYFGYGAMEDPRVIEAVIGRKPNSVNAVLPGFELCVQRIDQVPDTVHPDAPAPLSPRAILQQSWPDTFESYTIRENERGNVRGKVWLLLHPEERDRLADWELIEFGWFRDIQTLVRIDGGKMDVITEGLAADQEIDRVVDGLEYDSLLVPIGDILKVAEKAKREFDTRKKA